MSSKEIKIPSVEDVRPIDRLRIVIEKRPDTVVVAALVVLLFLIVAFRWLYDNWLTEMDIFTAFLPSFTYVGSRLREFEIPAWNPYSSGGAPMLGDSQSGWMYLPVMFAFFIFNPINGMKVLILLQTLIGGVSAYYLARQLRLNVVPAFLAALSFGIGPLIYAGTTEITVSSQLNAFLPLALLGIERALRAERLSARIGWSVATGVASTQMIYAWTGQGAMYSALIVGGWMAWRLLIERVPEVGSLREHANRLVVSGIVVIVTVVGFGAAGILPRLDFNSQSNVPGGDYSQVVGGDYRDIVRPLDQSIISLIVDGYSARSGSIAITVLLLAVLAVTRFRMAHGVYFWGLVALSMVEITTGNSIFRSLLG
ncbi:MAG: hypothetical protein WKF81_11940, partial [Thermomicrobiales bacterium]